MVCLFDECVRCVLMCDVVWCLGFVFLFLCVCVCVRTCLCVQWLIDVVMLCCLLWLCLCVV